MHHMSQWQSTSFHQSAKWVLRLNQSHKEVIWIDSQGVISWITVKLNPLFIDDSNYNFCSYSFRRNTRANGLDPVKLPCEHALLYYSSSCFALYSGVLSMSPGIQVALENTKENHYMKPVTVLLFVYLLQSRQNGNLRSMIQIMSVYSWAIVCHQMWENNHCTEGVSPFLSHFLFRFDSNGISSSLFTGCSGELMILIFINIEFLVVF